LWVKGRLAPDSTDLQIGVRISFDSGQDRGSLSGASHERGYVQNGNVGSDEPGQNLSANLSARGSATPWQVGPAAFGEQVKKRKLELGSKLRPPIGSVKKAR
jgi:hypothetical protein